MKQIFSHLIVYIYPVFIIYLLFYSLNTLADEKNISLPAGNTLSENDISNPDIRKDEIINDEQHSATVKSGWYIDSSFSLKYNYDGLALKAKIYYKFPLMKKAGMLWNSTGINIGVQEYLTPAFQRVSAYLKIMPIAFFDISSYAGYDYMFKEITGGMKEVKSPDSGYNPESLDKIDGKVKGGFRMAVIPSLKFAYHNVAAMYSFKIEYHEYNQTEYFYDYETNLIHKGKDIGFKHDATIAYMFKLKNKADNLKIAVNFTDYRVRGTGKNNMIIMGALQYNTAGWLSLPETFETNLSIAAGSYLQDRYKKGEPTLVFSTGIKYKLN
jgi:hypothetical protein